MKVVSVGDLANLEKKMAVAIGFFDGVHLGHQKIINNVTCYAKKNKLKSVVITFDQSPKTVLGNVPNDGCLTPTDEKLRILEEMGIDYALILKFDKKFLSLSKDQFIIEYLLKIRTCYVSVGFDFRFGQGGAGDTKYLQSHGGFNVEVSEAVEMFGVKVSTTQIKKYLQMGDLDSANQMFGRRYSVGGKVGRGRQLGRKIGFPTANLEPAEDYLCPLRGVYATVSHVGGASFTSMTNIGFNPTANLRESISIETYIFDFDADIYDEQMYVEFVSKIRDEIKFDGLDALIAQLEKDKNAVKMMSI